MPNDLPCPKCGTRWNAPAPQSNQADAPEREAKLADVVNQLRGLADEMRHADGATWRETSAVFLRDTAATIERAPVEWFTAEQIFVIRQSAAVLQGILSYSPAGREDLARKLFAIADTSVPND